MAFRGAVGHDRPMQVLHARSVVRPASRMSTVAGLTIGLLLLALSGILGYLVLATPFAERFIPAGRAGTAAIVASALGWTLMLVAPSVAAIAGLAWLLEVADRRAQARPSRHMVSGLAEVLGAEYAAATGIRLPDGRIVSEVIVGPHGIAVFEPLPPRSLTRRHGGKWELQVGKGHWVPLENPLDRTVRSADRVRRWIGADERDFVVKVHAAVIASPGDALARTSACAVITRDQVPAYLNSLPVHRGLTAERRAQIFERIRSAV